MLGLPMFEPAAGGQRMVWSVASLIHAVADALSARFAACTVRGELSGFSRAASGHCYFSLKDADGAGVLIRCAMFRRAAMLLDFEPSDGELVELRGRLALYEPRGELQFVVEAMRCGGAGALFEQFLKLKSRLEAEGLFDAARKRELPRFPRRIGIVTSLAAAALHDVLTCLARRAPHVDVVIYPAPVQGREAPAALAAAIALADRRREVDLLLVCRGGGSLEDLWAFNDEQTVRAVVACQLPLIAGVGHETDVTLIDFAADLRAATPTAAAELAVPATRDCLEALQSIAARLVQRVRHGLDMRDQQLDRLALRMARPADLARRAERAVAALGHRLVQAAHAAARRRAVAVETVADRLGRAPDALLARQRHRLQAMTSRLEALDPHRVLARGYAWVEDAGGVPVQSVGRLQIGEPLRLVLIDGEADLRVTATRAAPGGGD
jgi:exodeoxyribonuclease VII large subunit